MHIYHRIYHTQGGLYLHSSSCVPSYSSEMRHNSQLLLCVSSFFASTSVHVRSAITHKIFTISKQKFTLFDITECHRLKLLLSTETSSSAAHVSRVTDMYWCRGGHYKVTYIIQLFLPDFVSVNKGYRQVSIIDTVHVCSLTVKVVIL